jgi:hypothetical protein
MKRISAIALLTVGILAASTGLVAQERVVTANIPFNFTVGEKGMPAGEYTISSPGRNIIQIESKDKKHIASVIGTQSYHESTSTPQLVFDRYGSYYFLHRVLSAKSTPMNADIPLGNVEKRLRTREAKLQTGEETLVAAR